MAEKTIEIVIDPKGQVTMTAVGYSGTVCEGALRPYQEALGQVLSDTPHESYFEVEVSHEQQAHAGK